MNPVPVNGGGSGGIAVRCPCGQMAVSTSRTVTLITATCPACGKTFRSPR